VPVLRLPVGQTGNEMKQEGIASDKIGIKEKRNKGKGKWPFSK
jgi:hypothetical protein